MITFSSVGTTQFSLELSDSPNWSQSFLGGLWGMTLRNEMQNVVKVVEFPAATGYNNRFITFQIIGVSTAGAEDLAPVSGDPSVYFGKEGIGTWTWTIDADTNTTGPLASGYAKVVSTNVATDEIDKATFVSDNEDLETIIYTS